MQNTFSVRINAVCRRRFRLRLVFCLVLISGGGLCSGQPLDWSSDLILFGTEQNESMPVLISAPDGSILHAVCRCGDDMISAKMTLDAAQSWSNLVQMEFPAAGSGICGTMDDQYAYFLFFGGENPQRRIIRINRGESDWSSALSTDVVPERIAHTVAAELITDMIPHPDDPYLSLFWIEETDDGMEGIFTQSRDRGLSFQTETQVFSRSSSTAYPCDAAMAVSWSGDEERILLAATLDRPGSIQEEVRIFVSTDQGSSWTSGLIIDSSSYVQLQPSIAAFGNTVIVVWSRRSGAAAQKDLYLSYSLDGGISFAPPLLAVGTDDDEFSASVSVDGNGQYYHVLYLAGEFQSEDAAVMILRGSVESPWLFESPVMISESENAVAEGGLNTAVCEQGVGAVWTSPFLAGDTDIRFDASFYGTSTERQPSLVPSGIEVYPAYPNPFNGTTILPLHLSLSSDVIVKVYNELGREVSVYFSGYHTTGLVDLTIDLRAFPSGVYFADIVGSGQKPVKLVLLK